MSFSIGVERCHVIFAVGLWLLNLPNGCSGWCILREYPHRWSLRLRASEDANDRFFQVFRDLGFRNEADLQQSLENKGLWNNGSQLLETICRDFYSSQRPEQLTKMLQEDFHLEALQAHMIRSTLWSLYAKEEEEKEKSVSESSLILESEKTSVPTKHVIVNNAVNITRPRFKEVALLSTPSNRSAYGLASIFGEGENSVLQVEIDDFWHEFMTRPNPYHPTANPLRNETAKVYVRHANLFLGWYLQNHVAFRTNMTSTSLRSIFKDDSVESVSILLDFIRWLREDRKISASYEANVWRGLTKLLQYRHTQLEGKHASTLEGRPAFVQMRKWHTEAQNTAKNAPRRSQEDRKWLSWEDYLGVVKHCKQEYLNLQQQYYKESKQTSKTGEVSNKERKVAVALQRYLILAIFAIVPDRQRTIRELKLHRSFIKDTTTGIWNIKHGPDDYKTGKTYGERPSLQLNGLTEDIDNFLENWRPMLRPKTDYVFVQPRTSNPMTQDSIYQIVSRACYQCTGQRTNPHLLRDMIVTHVRESTTTSEAELEALAMLMGHSVAVQRASYDRRTLTQKVAPAVGLMRKINNGHNNF
jgi:integrase